MNYQQVIVQKATGWYCFFAPAETEAVWTVDTKFVYDTSLKGVIKKARKIKPDGLVLFTYLKRN